MDADDIECSCHSSDDLLITESDEEGRVSHLRNGDIRRQHTHVKDIEFRVRVKEAVRASTILVKGDIS